MPTPELSGEKNTSDAKEKKSSKKKTKKKPCEKENANDENGRYVSIE